MRDLFGQPYWDAEAGVAGCLGRVYSTDTTRLRVASGMAPALWRPAGAVNVLIAPNEKRHYFLALAGRPGRVYKAIIPTTVAAHDC